MTHRVLKGLAYALLAVAIALIIFVQILLTPFHGQLEKMGVLEGNENTSMVAFILLSVSAVFLSVNIYLGLAGKIDLSRSLLLIHAVFLLLCLGTIVSWI